MDENKDIYREKTLENEQFDGKVLSEFDFSGSVLVGSTFRNSVLRSANFNNADIRGCDFSGADLSRANFEKAHAGVNEDRLADLLFGSLGISALFAASGAASNSAPDVSIDNSDPAQSVSIPVLASLVSLSGGTLFLLSFYKSWVSHSEAAATSGIFVSTALFFLSFLSFRKAIAVLKQMSSTSFRNADLSDANFKDATLASTDFFGANLNGVDLSGVMK